MTKAGNHEVKRIRLLAYGQQFTSNAMPIYPAYAIMFGERSGLSTSDISALFLIWNAAAMAAEVPTGMLADRISRRAVMVMSTLITAVAFSAWFFVPNFWGYALGFVLWGVGFAMSSGALQAYLYDELAALGRSHSFTKIYSRARSAGFAGMFAGFMVAIAAGIDAYTLLLTSSVAMCVVATGLACMFPKDRPRFNPGDEKTQHLRGALRAVRRSPSLARIVASIALIGGAAAAMEEYVPIYYQVVGVSLDAIPVLLPVGVVLGMIVTWFAHKFEHAHVQYLVLMGVAAGLCLFSATYAPMPLAVAGMLAFMALVRLSGVLFEAALQHGYDENSRATLGSLPVFLDEVWVVVLTATYGAVALWLGDFAAFRTVAVTVALVVLLLGFAWRGHSPRMSSSRKVALDIRDAARTTELTN